jgi:protein involved in polysaccharide export with SLBB domain
MSYIAHRMFAGVAWLVCAATLAAQQPTTRPARNNSSNDDVAQVRTPGLSDLSKDNYGRVAASASDIKAALIGNPGLIVELKLLIAKEATDNGQVVQESDLSDQAVYERLAADTKFRAAATRLCQRYGYLLPKVNPDSEVAKEQEFVLKERARRLVQIESQEDSESLKPRGLENTKEKTSACDPQSDDDCRKTLANTEESREPRQRSAEPREQQRSYDGQEQPSAPIVSDRVLRAQGNTGDEIYGNTYGNTTGLINATDRYRTPGNAIPDPNAPPDGGNGTPYPFARDQASSPRRPDLSQANDMASASESSEAIGARPMENLRRGEPRLRSGVPAEKELEPVAMVRKPSPYADVPSMYDLYVQATPRDAAPQRFGIAVFRDGMRDPRAVPMDLPVGPDYVVGPGDSLAIDMWGGMSARVLRVVDRQGRITLPEAGPVQVSGRPLQDVQQAVQKALATEFRDTSADVSVAKLRTVRVYVVGEVGEPGAYDISSLSTPINALVAAGGVTPRGSLRKLQHYRGRQLLEEVDAYDLLLHGVTPDAKRLENGDTLMVPPAGQQVTVTGMVRRQAIYELNGEKNLADVLDLAGGILPAAALKHVEVQRLVANQSRTMLSLDLSTDAGTSPDLSAFKIQDGDKVHIFPIAPYNQDAIYLQGHVLRPGRYSFKPGMTLADLVASYKDLLPEPAHYAEIVRLSPPDFKPGVQSFDLTEAMKDPSRAPKLEALDTVRIFSRFDFEPAPTVWVGGEVRKPGKYTTSGQAHLRDAVYLAGGLTPDATIQSAELFRTEADGNTKILSVNLKEALAGDPLQNILLEPRDRLLIHRNFEQVDPPTVEVTGEVAKPGRYPLTGNMQVGDLLRVAGGFKHSADTAKADLTRYPMGGNAGEHIQVSLAALSNDGGDKDIPLRNGDVLTIRQVPGWKDLGASVAVQGEVQHPGSYGIQPGERLSSVLSRTGGYTGEAFPYGAVLMRQSVRDEEEKAHAELVRRVEAQQVNIRLMPEADQDQKNGKLNAIAQTQTTLDQLRLNPPVGRLVVHIDQPAEKWRNTPADVAMRDGDILIIPKKSGYVMVNGQVFNPTAITYRGARSAKWYLGQAGGTTQLADKKSIFVVRADGSVISARNQSGFWSGDPLSATLRPGDTVVVPEKALNVGGKNWTAIMQTAQVASSVALAVAYIHP